MFLVNIEDVGRGYETVGHMTAAAAHPLPMMETKLAVRCCTITAFHALMVTESRQMSGWFQSRKKVWSVD